MAKFQYKMQNILSLKEKMEEQAKNQYSVTKLVVDTEENKLEVFRQRKGSYENELRIQVKERLVIRDIIQTQHAVKNMKYHIDEQIQVVNRAKTRLEIARGRMNEAMIERKTHERLKEKAFVQFKQELIQTENKEVDELVSYKYNKSSEDV